MRVRLTRVRRRTSDPAMDPAWQTIDAVVLHAIAALGRRGNDLYGIVYEADYANRMVYERQEMEEALQRLIGSGLIVDKAGRFMATPAGRTVYRRTRFRSVHERLRRIVAHLIDHVPCTPTADWNMRTGAYESAVARHYR